MTKNKRTRRWTKDEELALLQGVGANGLEWIKKHSGDRSVASIYNRLDRLTGSGGLTRGSFTLIKACKATGYSACQLKRARDALKQKWKRTSKNGSYFITEDQLAECTDWLNLDYWSVKYHLYKCVWCYKREYKHLAYGLCQKCFNEYRELIGNLGLYVCHWAFIVGYLKSKYNSNSELINKCIDKGIMVPKEYLVGDHD